MPSRGSKLHLCLTLGTLTHIIICINLNICYYISLGRFLLNNDITLWFEPLLSNNIGLIFKYLLSFLLMNASTISKLLLTILIFWSFIAARYFGICWKDSCACASKRIFLFSHEFLCFFSTSSMPLTSTITTILILRLTSILTRNSSGRVYRLNSLPLWRCWP